MNCFERESLDRHITGNHGADQLREDEWEDATLAGFEPEEPEEPEDFGGVFDGFGVVSDADPGL